MIIELFPSSLLLILAEVSLLIVGFVAEKHYVSRITLFTNSIALTIHILSQESIGFWIGMYTDLALFIGSVGLFAYVSNRSLSWVFYDISYFLFSSINIALIISFSDFSFIVPLLLGIVLQVFLLRFDNDSLVHKGQYPESVKWFHQHHIMEFTDHRGRHSYYFSGWFR
jgi:hypothetical protein